MQVKENAFVFYCAAEHKNNSLSMKLFIYTIFADCSVFMPSAFLPIMYAIVGFPEPRNWSLLFPAK